MNIYLVRHGDAVSDTEDVTRPLSALGRWQIEQLALRLKTAHVSMDIVYHSGVLRAHQTAQLLVDAVGGTKLITRPDLSPNASAGRIQSEIENMQQSAMLVGHLPQLGMLAALLMTGKSTPVPVEFGTGTILCLTRSRFSGNLWALEWMIGPALFGHFGGLG